MGGDNKAAVERLKKVMESGDLRSMADAMDEVTADDFVEEWPQSGERLTKAASMRMGRIRRTMSSLSCIWLPSSVTVALTFIVAF